MAPKRQLSAATLAALATDDSSSKVEPSVGSASTRAPSVVPSVDKKRCSSTVLQDTPGRKRRRIGAKESQLSLESLERAPNQGASGAESVVSGSGASGVTDGSGVATKPGKHCVGCRRVTGVDYGFLRSPDSSLEDVKWYYQDGRADWCNACMRVYNTYYKSSMSVVVFEAWLSNPQNHLSFTCKAVAFIIVKSKASRKSENSTTIRLKGT